MSLLRLRVFRALLIATLISNIGEWMEDVGETWLMTSLHGTPLMVALVQSSASLPVFLFALPAGTLADIVDRRRLLLATQIWSMLVAALLGALTLTGHIRAWGLLGCTFAMGIGSALEGPAWEAVLADVVPRAELARATVWSGVAFNLGRVVGPAVGGLVVAWAGPGAVFLLNAVTFVLVIVEIARWKRTHHPSHLPAERRWTGSRTGFRYVREAVSLRTVLLRTFVVLLCASALWALLPSLVRRELHGAPSDYGLLLGTLGAGALAGAGLLSRLRAPVGVDAILIPATLVLAIGIAGLALAPTVIWAALATFVCGVAWLALSSTSMGAAQKSSADWVRARALAVFLLVTEGAMAFGSLAWGWLATRTSERFALGWAAVGVAASLGVAYSRRLRDLDTIDRTPASIYPIPEAPEGIDEEEAPVVVEIEYRVDAQHRHAFRQALEKLGRSRRRTGAALWLLTEDSHDPTRFVEIFFIESWNEHLRQHGRWTKSDEALWRHARTLVAAGTEPKVTHLVGALPSRRE